MVLVKVFVAGGTGVAGKQAVRALLGAGHRVTAVARSPDKAQQLSEQGAEPLVVDLLDPRAVRQALSGFDAVCNLTTHIPSLSRAGRRQAWRENDLLRRQVSANLIDSAIAAGVRRMVQESVLFVYPDCKDEWVTEQTLTQPPDYVQSALDAEAAAGRLTEAGGIGVVLRFAQFYGPSSGQTGEMVRLARRWRLAPAVGPGSGWMASLHEEDAGTAVNAALNVLAGIWNVGDEPVRRREWTAALSHALHRRLVFGGRLLTPFMGVVGTAASGSIRLSSRSFRQASGWQPRYHSVIDGWPAVVRELEASR